MTMKRSNRILVIDDEPGGMEEGVRLGLGERGAVEVVHPQDVTIESLAQAHVVLVDYALDHWHERDAITTIGLKPRTGFSLSAILREHSEAVAERRRITAFAIHSGHLDELKGHLPAASSQQVIARLHNLEWFFPKGSSEVYSQVIILAEAVRALPYQWQAEDVESLEDKWRQFLGLDEAMPWVARAWEDVRKCQPPTQEVGEPGHGMLFLRWLLHRVLPYPCFLWGEHWLAARLRVTVSWLREILAGDSRLAGQLKQMEYSGILAGFLGRRWWSAGCEEYVWTLTTGRSLDIKSLHDELERRSGVRPEAINANPAFVCLGSDLQPNGTFLAAEEAVRLHPDDWPGFADQAWTSVALVKQEPVLRSMVDPADLHRLKDAE